MKGSWITKRTVAIAALAMAAGAVLGAASASAQPVTNGSLSFSGDPGDYISGGRSYAYSTANGDRLTVGGNGNHIGVSVTGYNGDWWYLDLAAPTGQTLAPGTYDRATRYPFHGAGPGLDVSGNGRGCNRLTGTFTIQNIALGPNGYVQTLDATYEQHCEGAEPALRGEVHIDNPPPPAPVAWSASADPTGTTPFQRGRAEVKATASATDPQYGNIVSVDKTTVVTLKRSSGS